MADRNCTCTGLNLLRELFNTYILYDSGKPYKYEAQTVLNALHDHIDRQANKPGNEPLYKKVEYILQVEKDGIKAVSKGKESPMGDSGLDRLRDDIHKYDDMKQLLVCGGPYTSDGLEDTAKVVKIVMDIMADPNPEMGSDGNLVYPSVGELAERARKPLDGLVAHLECKPLTIL